MGRMKELLMDLEYHGLTWDDYVAHQDDQRKAKREEQLIRSLPQGYGKAENEYLTKLETQAEDESVQTR